MKVTQSCSVRMDDRPRQMICHIFSAMAASGSVESGPRAQNIVPQAVRIPRVAVRVLFGGVPNREMFFGGLVV